MGNILIVAGLIVIGLLLIMVALYISMIMRIRGFSRKVYKYKEEKNLLNKNVLIIYQPSKHQTTYKIVENIKEVLNAKGYGYFIHTLTEDVENYGEYEKVIFVAPVYFGEIHLEFLKKVMNCKIDNLIMVYNGLNKESNKEDEFVERHIKKYSKIKLYSEDIERVKEFIDGEVK